MASMANLLNVSKQYLDIVNKQPALHTMTPAEVRRLRQTNSKKQLERNVQLKSIEDKFISMRDGETIKIRIYTPLGNGPFPIIVYYHGGGWVLNSIETCHESCQLLSFETNSIIVSVDYRLAPEYKFPIPVYDAYDSFLWTYKNAQMINGLVNKISVMGDSAGANLATVVTLINKELQGPSIHSQVLLYPVTDLSYESESYEQFKVGYGLEKKDMEWFGRYYLNNENEKTHPYAAPLRAFDLGNLPPACIIVAENDVLRDEGNAYAKRLKDSGVNVDLHTAAGLVHSFFTKNEIFTVEIADTIAFIKNYLKQLI